MIDGNTVAERLHDQADRIFAPDLKRAREEISDRIMSGKKVCGQGLQDLLDTALNGNDYRTLLASLSLLLLGSEDYTRDELASGITENLIERFLDGHPEETEELAADIAAERE